MPRIRTFALALALILAGALAPKAAEAQLAFGAHVAHATEFEDGVFGLGAKVGIDPPLLPLAFYAGVDYFFPDCEGLDGCGYQTFNLDANWTLLPMPVVDVYLSGGLTVRRVSVEGTVLGFAVDESTTATGFSAGAGVAFNFILGAFVEARQEFFGDEDGGNQTVIRLGLLF